MPPTPSVWGDEIGALAPGKRADLLVVAGDPTREVRALADVRAVWLDGARVVDRPETASGRPRATG